MGSTQCVPSGNWPQIQPWTVTGTTSHWTAVSDASDATYIATPASASAAIFAFPRDITAVPAGATITGVTIKIRAATGAGSPPSGQAASVTVSTICADSTNRFQVRTVQVTSASATDYTVATYTRDARQFPWDIHRLNQVLVGLFSYCSVADVVRVYKVIVEVNYRTKPTVVVTAPSGTVTTSSPTIAWTYTQTEGDAQVASQVRLFTATQVTDVSFAPDTAAAVYAHDSTGDLSSILLPTSINSDSYWVYVRSQSTFGSWSSWASRQFVVSAPGPASPGVADVSGVYPAGVGVIDIVADATAGAATLTLRDTSNLISASEADAEVLSDWVAIDTTNVGNHARDTTQGFGNSTSSWKITAGGAGDMAIISDWVEVAADTPVTARTQFKAATTGRSCRVRVLFFDNSYASVGGTLTGSSVSDSTSSWTEATVTGTSPAGATLARVYSEVLSAGASEVHNVDRVGLSHGTSVPWSDGGMAARNLLSAWYSTAEGGAPAGESWTPGTASSTGTNSATGTGYSGGSSHKMTYVGLTPSIAFRAAGTTFNSATSGTDFTLNKPAGVASGDLMLAALTTNESSLTLTPPAGWDLVNTASINDGSDDSVLYVLKRTAGGSEPSTWTDGFLSATCTRRTALVVAYSGAADAALQFVGEGSSATSSDAPMYVTSPTVNNTDPNAWRVSAFAGRDDVTGGSLVANTTSTRRGPADRVRVRGRHLGLDRHRLGIHDQQACPVW